MKVIWKPGNPGWGPEYLALYILSGVHILGVIGVGAVGGGSRHDMNIASMNERVRLIISNGGNLLNN